MVVRWGRAAAMMMAALLSVVGCEAGLVRGTEAGKDNTISSLPQTVADSNTTPATGTQPVASNGNAASPNAITPAPAAKKGPGIAVYWGTGNSSGKDANFATVCATPQYDIIIISFANAIGSHTRNMDGYPEMSISGCGGAYNSRNPYLPNCSAVGNIIPTCQAAGKKVILSLGGGDSSVGFASDAEGAAYATTMWNLVLGGNGNVRPFGTAVLDGIDLDIEGGSATGYGAFVAALRALMDADSKKSYIITAAPQCVFPDAWMGPNPNTAITVAPAAFDHLFVQFYNNDCHWANADAFATTYKQWSTLNITRQPKIWIGLPPTTDAATAADYVPVTALPTLVRAGSAFPAYGGVMLWDAGYDLIDTAAVGVPYSQSVAQAQNQLTQ